MGSCPLKTWEVSGLCHIETIVPLFQGLPFPEQASVVSHTERMKSRSGHCRVNFRGKKERDKKTCPRKRFTVRLMGLHLIGPGEKTSHIRYHHIFS